MDDEEQQNQDTSAEEAGAEEGEEDDSGSSLLVPFIVFLIAAIFTDILSLIPYVGLIASWPFALFFLGYKYMSGMDFKRTVWVSAGDVGAEGFFSSLPANTADVCISFAMKSKIIGKLAAAFGRAGKIIAAVATKGKGAGGAKAVESGVKAGAAAEGVPAEGAPAAGAVPAAEAGTAIGEAAPEAGATPEAAGLRPEEIGLPPEERAPGIRAPEEVPEKPEIAPEEKAELEEAVGEKPEKLEELIKRLVGEQPVIGEEGEEKGAESEKEEGAAPKKEKERPKGVETNKEML